MNNYRILLALFLVQALASQSVEDIPEEIKAQILDQQLFGSLEDESNEIEDVSVNEINEFTENEFTDSEFFGYEFFSKAPGDQLASFDIPLQSDYRISFGDKIQIVLIGNQNKTYNLDVDLSGDIFLPEIGRVNLKDLTISEADKRLGEIIKLSYIGTDSFLTVISASLKKIAVIGAVKNPGTFIVNPFISLSEALKYSSGLVEGASLRSVEVRDIQGSSSVYDLYDFLIYGDRSSDINLKNGDTVIVKSSSSFVGVGGEVHRPKIYEYDKDDSFNDLIAFAQGTTSKANQSNIRANYILDNRLISKKVNLNDSLKSYDLRELVVGSTEEIKSLDAFVDGDSVTRGYFDYTQGQSIESFLTNLSFEDNIYPYFVVLSQTDQKGQQKVKNVFSLKDPKSYEDIELLENPSFFFLSRNDLKILSTLDEDIADEFTENADDLLERKKQLLRLIPAENIIRVIHDRKSVLFPATGMINLKEVYSFLGTQDGYDFNNTSVITKTKDTVINRESLVINSEDLSAVSFPFDLVEFINVTLEGETNFAGNYDIPVGSNLNSFYRITGLLNSKSEIGVAILARESVKNRELNALESSRRILKDLALQQLSNTAALGNISLDFDFASIIALSEQIEVQGRISGNFLPGNSVNSEMILQNGDVITLIPPLRTVSILGEVANPTTILYSAKKSIKDYIELSGNYTKFANKRGIYIIRSSGESVPISTSIFQKDVALYPGDTIVVPRDLSKVDALPLVSIATQIISDIAFSAASLNVLKN